MTREEYVGSFYVWAPRRLRGIVGSVLGFSPADLQRGGRLQRLNRDPDSDFAAADLAAERAGRPDQTVSLYRQARAERVKLEDALAAAGDPHAQPKADLVLKQRAMGVIEKHLWQHLLMTVPLLWGGAPFTFVVLLASLAVAVRQRRFDLGAVALPAFGVVMFYALLSHFIPRYADPVRPLAVALTLVLLKWLWDARARGKVPQLATG
jgi:hypothetical protein